MVCTPEIVQGCRVVGVSRHQVLPDLDSAVIIADGLVLDGKVEPRAYCGARIVLDEFLKSLHILRKYALRLFGKRIGEYERPVERRRIRGCERVEREFR